MSSSEAARAVHAALRDYLAAAKNRRERLGIVVTDFETPELNARIVETNGIVCEF